MMISGANNLYNNKKLVDELNVFPVPDGDTGTNMSLTIQAMANALNQHRSLSVGIVAEQSANATLRGARGNSGVILSQFYRGIAKSLKGKQTCTPLEFAQGLKEGSDVAYKAVMNPTEGTILTVARESAVHAVISAQRDSDLITVMEDAVKRGNKILLKTPDMLLALKEAGVVDAGGKGWMCILEGILYFLKNNEIIEKSDNSIEIHEKSTKAQNITSTEKIKYAYCTEFIIEKKKTDVNVTSFRQTIEKKGDSMLVIDDDDIVKVHIHTNNPGFVLERAVMLGSMINIKIDNMKQQHQSLISQEMPKKEKPFEKYGFITVCSGDGLVKVFNDLGIEEVIQGGQTMNPSTDDILNAVDNINAEHIFIFPNNKNIILAANQAKELSDKHLIIIPTKTIPQSISAMLVFDKDSEPDNNEQKMLKAINQVKTGQVTYAVRDTEIDGKKVKTGDILGIEGSEIISVGNDINTVCYELIDNLIDDDSEFITIYHGSDVDKDTALLLEHELEARYADMDISIIYGGQPLYYYIISVE